MTMSGPRLRGLKSRGSRAHSRSRALCRPRVSSHVVISAVETKAVGTSTSKDATPSSCARHLNNRQRVRKQSQPEDALAVSGGDITDGPQPVWSHRCRCTLVRLHTWSLGPRNVHQVVVIEEVVVGVPGRDASAGVNARLPECRARVHANATSTRSEPSFTALGAVQVLSRRHHPREWFAVERQRGS